MKLKCEWIFLQIWKYKTYMGCECKFSNCNLYEIDIHYICFQCLGYLKIGNILENKCPVDHVSSYKRMVLQWDPSFPTEDSLLGLPSSSQLPYQTQCRVILYLSLSDLILHTTIYIYIFIYTTHIIQLDHLCACRNIIMYSHISGLMIQRFRELFTFRRFIYVYDRFNQFLEIYNI